MEYFKLFLLFFLAAIGCAEKFEENASIQSCVYMDAHWLECWWEESKDVGEKYRLAFLRESDPIDRRPFYMCTDEESKHALPHVSSASRIMKSCAFPAHMFSTYHIYLVTDECHEGDYLCYNTTRLDFECSPDFVYLLSPPSHLEVNDELMILNWQAPDRPGTMLQFALFERRVRYQVSYRIIGVNQEWDAFYEGYQTQVSLPPLMPSTDYEIKIEAKLDPPEGSFLHEVNVHEWGSPEVHINFTSPAPATYSAPAADLLENEDKEEMEPTVTHHEQMNNKVMPTVIILSICIVVLALVVFLLFYCKCISCKKERKIGKPLLLVDITKQSFQRPRQAYGSNIRDQSEDVEKFAPISSLLRLHSNGNMAEEHCLKDSPVASSFVIVKENNNEEDFQPRQRAELVPTVINDSISINEELSDIDDSMCDMYTKQSSTSLYKTDEVSSPTNYSITSGSSHQTYIDTTASTTSDSSPYSLPNYIWGPSNTGHSSYTTSPSVSSYVLGGGTLVNTLDENEKLHFKNVWRPQMSPHIGGKSVIVLPITDVCLPGTNVMSATCPVCHVENCCQHMDGCEGGIQNNEAATNSRRNSISDHSVDSGYSPDGLDATTTV